MGVYFSLKAPTGEQNNYRPFPARASVSFLRLYGPLEAEWLDWVATQTNCG